MASPQRAGIGAHARKTRLGFARSEAWLADVLARIAAHTAHQLDELLPWNWRQKEKDTQHMGGLTMHINKVSHVTTIDRIAAQLGESIDFFHDVANEMEPQDSVIWVYGLGDQEVLAFTDFGIENLVELIKIHKEMQSHQER